MNKAPRAAKAQTDNQASKNQGEGLGVAPPGDKADGDACALPQGRPPRIKRLQLAPTKPLSASAVLDMLKSRWQERERVLQANAARARKQGDEATSDGVLVFHPDSLGGRDLTTALREAGVSNIDTVSTSEQAFLLLRSLLISRVFVWYQPNLEGSLNFLAELSEARDHDRRLIQVICPGEAALSDLQSKGAHLLWDHAGILERGPGKLTPLLKAADAAYTDEQSPQAILAKLRRAMRRDQTRPRPPSLKELDERGAALNAYPEKRYWAQASRVLNLLILGKKDLALEAAIALSNAFPETLDARLVLANARACAQSPAAAIEELRPLLTKHPQLTPIRFERIGRMLLLWKAYEPLGTLLEEWQSRIGTGSDSGLNFLAAGYYRGLGDLTLAEPWLFAAVAAEPFNATYLEALARHFAQTRYYERAADAWQLTMKARYANIGTCQLGLAEALAMSRRTREALEILDALSNDAEHAKAAAALKAKLFPLMAG